MSAAVEVGRHAPPSTSASARISTSPQANNIPDLSHRIPRLVPRQKKPPVAAPASSESKQPPVPTPPLSAPPPIHSLSFTTPVRRIFTRRDHDLFLQSPTYTLILSFILTLTDSVRDTAVSDVSRIPESYHPTTKAILKILEKAQSVVDRHPPDAKEHESRFGNPIFRDVLRELETELPRWHADAFPLSELSSLDEATRARHELNTYFVASLGSPQRLDYGSGHELHFFLYLLSLYRLSFFSLTTPPTSTPAPATTTTNGPVPVPVTAFREAALLLLPSYLRLARRLQSLYFLEPAGSHGVWGLDDFQFIPFLIGSSQLSSHAFIRPLAIHSQATREQFGDEYLYLDMVRAADATKTVRGLRWHSPMLDDISGVRGGWPRVEHGLRRMFVGEVLGKSVVAQHILFGGILPAPEGCSEPPVAVTQGVCDDLTHDHTHEHGELDEGESAKGWGDCCGIRVPSAAAAKTSAESAELLRTIPLD